MSNVQSTPTASLKPERIGLTVSVAGHSPLKPERIGQRLQKLPGWELLTAAEGQALWRGFRFHRTETAQAFAAFVARVAAEYGQRPVISQSWNEVTVTVPGEGGITEVAFDFAEVMMLLPGGTEGAAHGDSQTASLPETRPETRPTPANVASGAF